MEEGKKENILKHSTGKRQPLVNIVLIYFRIQIYNILCRYAMEDHFHSRKQVLIVLNLLTTGGKSFSSKHA